MTPTTNALRPAILSLGWDINSRTLRLWVYLPPDAVANPNYALLGNCLTIRSAWGNPPERLIPASVSPESWNATHYGFKLEMKTTLRRGDCLTESQYEMASLIEGLLGVPVLVLTSEQEMLTGGVHPHLTQRTYSEVRDLIEQYEAAAANAYHIPPEMPVSDN